MARFFLDSAIMAAVFLLFFLFTFAVLWRFKSKGAYTLLLGIFFEIVFQFAGYALVPQAMQYHHTVGMSPVVQGMVMGCCMPMVFMTMYYVAQNQKRRRKTP